MKLFVGGARGTAPWTDPAAAVFGGDTTSFLIDGEDGSRLVIDAGSGLRHIESLLVAEPRDKKVLCLFTHYHLDHVLGLPVFWLVYDGDWALTMASPGREGRSVEAALTGFIRAPWWPLELNQVKRHIEFETWPDAVSPEPRRWGGFEIRWCPVQHPGGATAYRVDEISTGESLVVATDMEWGLSSETERSAFRALCTEPTVVDRLVMDGQVAGTDYAQQRGWGHSTWEECVALAQELAIPSLVITHHARLTDDALLARERSMQAVFAGVELVRQGRWYGK